MKYVRVVLALRDEDTEAFEDALDVFIEGTDVVQGAYVSAGYYNRQQALHDDWRESQTRYTHFLEPEE